MTENGEYKNLQLMSPKEFKESFAPMLSVATCRELFYREDFPAVKIGQRLFTTPAAAKSYLEKLEKGEL